VIQNGARTIRNGAAPITDRAKIEHFLARTCFAQPTLMTSSPIPTNDNRGTRTPRLEPPSPRDAYALARNLEQARPPQTVPGHRIYWMTSSGFGCRDLQAGTRSALVVGNHPLCDVRLTDEVGVELRHLLLRSSLVDDGCPILSVLDLHTAHGFYLSNGSAERSIDATGAVVLRVGAYAIVALPSGSPIPEDLPPSIVQSSPESPYRIAGLSPELTAQPFPGSSRITLLPRIVDAAESSTTFGERDTYEIAMTSPAGFRNVRVPASDLRRGVLVGRSLNCDPSLRMIVDMGISRGHLLIMKDRNGAVAYDLASTQGTYFYGRSTRAIDLSDEGTTLMIGSAQKIAITWRKIS
jgi:hypothetical protein